MVREVTMVIKYESRYREGIWNSMIPHCKFKIDCPATGWEAIGVNGYIAKKYAGSSLYMCNYGTHIVIPGVGVLHYTKVPIWLIEEFYRQYMNGNRKYPLQYSSKSTIQGWLEELHELLGEVAG